MNQRNESMIGLEYMCRGSYIATRVKKQHFFRGTK